MAICFILLLILTGKSRNNPAPAQSKPQVVTSFYPLYFFTSQIADDRANVSNITPAGIEPHDYEPQAQDIARIESSDLVILNGGGLEAWGDQLRQNVDPEKTIIIIAGDDLMTREILNDGKGIVDPHIWLSPPLAEKMVQKIVLGLVAVDPSNASYYQANASALEAKLAGLDDDYRQTLKNCPGRSIVTSHAAFGYLVATYNLTQVSITGLSPEVEPSLKQLADIVKFAKNNKVEYIFFESLVSPKLAKTIATEVGAQTLVLDPIEGLSEEDAAAGDDYFTKMRDNLANLKVALRCTI